MKQVTDAATVTTTALNSLRKEVLVLKLSKEDTEVLDKLVDSITKRSIDPVKAATDDVGERVANAFDNLEIANADREKLIEEQKKEREEVRATKARERLERARERATRRYIPIYPVAPIR